MPIMGGGGGGGGSMPSLESWLQNDGDLAAASGAQVLVTLTGVVPGFGPGYTNGPDDLGLVSQLPSTHPLLAAGTYRVHGTFSCGDPNIAAAAAGGAICLQFERVTASAFTGDDQGDGTTVALPCPAVTKARCCVEADFIVSDQDVLDEDNGLYVAVRNASNQDLTLIAVTVVIEKRA